MIIPEKKHLINQNCEQNMKNIPRIFIGNNVSSGMTIPLSREISHYLTHVMRRNDAIVFGGGHEFNATLDQSCKNIIVGNDTGHTDPSNNITLYFAPIKRTDDLINMVTQMGVQRIVPVITEHTNAAHINWNRMNKIAIEASEQSNRNSIPEIATPIKFSELNLSKLVFADERSVYDNTNKNIPMNTNAILVGPEGGFSDSEFMELDKAGAIGISLGKTILRAELAAPIAIARILK